MLIPHKLENLLEYKHEGIFDLLALFIIFSVAYTLDGEKEEESKKQEDDDGGDTKALMKELIKGVVAQMQEEVGRKSSTAELESTDLSALLQEEEEGGDGARE